MKIWKRKEPMVHEELTYDEMQLVTEFKSKVMMVLSVLVGGVALAWLAVALLRSTMGTMTHF